MKNIIIKTVIIAAIAALTLTGCSENNEIDEVTETEENATSTSPIETTTEENSTETTTSTTEAATTTETTDTTTTTATTTTTEAAESTVKPAEKPKEKSEEKPAEKPTHTHNFSKATCDKPATCTTCGATTGNALGHNFTSATCVKPAFCKTCGTTKGTVIDHNFYNGTCTMCGANDPNYIAPHNCDIDGHIWGNEYTEVVEEQGEIQETHNVSACGYDYTLANRYFGRTSSDVNFVASLGLAYGSGSTQVKTTGTKTITNYYHECSECGFKEIYNTEETVTSDGTTWEFVNKPRSPYYPVIWYDINNIPSEILEGAEREKADYEEWKKTLG